jgi:hypothetical protein
MVFKLGLEAQRDGAASIVTGVRFFHGEEQTQQAA